MEVGRNLLSSSSSFPLRTHLRNCPSSSVLMLHEQAASAVTSAVGRHFPTSVLLQEQRDEYRSSLHIIKEDKTSQMVVKIVTSRRNIACSAIQESSTTSTVAAETKDVKTAQKGEPAKPKPAAKAAAKPLPQLMEEDVIPSLRAILEAQDDLSDIELCFQDNKLEGSFLKEGNPYSFWAFFPNGVLTGPKGFSLSSYGSGASTVEPFLIDEKRITAKHVVFWVEKRLAAQGIIPVWKK